MPRVIGGLLWMAACGAPVEPPLAEGPQATDVLLTVPVGEETLTLHLDGAWVGDDGDGHGVSATASVPGPPPLTIVGKKSSWRLKEGIVIFEEDVEATRGEVVLRSDRLEVTYAGERVETAVATGNVRVERGERTATAERATLTSATGTVVLDGSPHLTEGPNELTGERLTLYLDEDRAECERCRLVVAGEAIAPKAP